MDMLDAREIRNEVRLLRERADKLEKIANIVESLPVAEAGDSGKQDKPGRPKITVPGETRLEQLANLLRARGPMSRSEIESEGFPAGTLASYLREAKGFVKLDDGRWTVPENMSNAQASLELDTEG